MSEFTVKFNDVVNTFDVDFTSSETFNTIMDQVVKVYPDPYDGDYEVMPTVEDNIVLNTKQKTMLDDVTVKKIPVYEIDNPQGGTTVYIAMEIE